MVACTPPCGAGAGADPACRSAQCGVLLGAVRQSTTACHICSSFTLPACCLALVPCIPHTRPPTTGSSTFFCGSAAFIWCVLVVLALSQSTNVASIHLSHHEDRLPAAGPVCPGNCQRQPAHPLPGPAGHRRCEFNADDVSMLLPVRCGWPDRAMGACLLDRHKGPSCLISVPCAHCVALPHILKHLCTANHRLIRSLERPEPLPSPDRFLVHYKPTNARLRQPTAVLMVATPRRCCRRTLLTSATTTTTRLAATGPPWIASAAGPAAASASRPSMCP